MEEKEIVFQSGDIKDLSDYITTIVRLSKSFDERQKLWFRGHASRNFELVPSLYRVILSDDKERSPYVLRPHDIYATERGIDLSFSRQATTFSSKNGVKDSQMNRYFLKQHYKVKTRLLDWTESSLVALYFAISDPAFFDIDAEVKVLLPFMLNSYTVQTLANDTSRDAKFIFYSVDEFEKPDDLFTERGGIRLNQLVRKYAHLDVKKDEQMFPIAIYPPFLDDRMKAQQSCFTLFGNMYNGLSCSEKSSQYLCSISIPASSKTVILK
ncbi:MAG: FRG domain-containing protein, partial [Sphingobacteriales bacterium]